MPLGLNPRMCGQRPHLPIEHDLSSPFQVSMVITEDIEHIIW